MERSANSLVAVVAVAAALVCAASGAPCNATGFYSDAADGQPVYRVSEGGQGVLYLETLGPGEGWNNATCSLGKEEAAGTPIACRFSGGSAANGTLARDCANISGWSNGAAAWIRVAPPTALSKIHLVFMTHLDLGFTDTTRGVCDEYFDKFFPAAFATAKALKERGGEERFVWTEFPWLLQEYLDGAAGCASRPRTAAEIQLMEDAILAGDMQWQANAANFLTENMDRGLWNYSLQMAGKLNQRFNQTHGTVAGKLSDVTGMSRSAVPTLAANGIRGMHVGYNGVGGLPVLPFCNSSGAVRPAKDGIVDSSTYCSGSSFGGGPAEAVFRWHHSETDAEVLFMLEDSYGSEVEVPATAEGHRASLLRAGPLDVALVFLFTADNSGSPSADTVVQFWQSLKKMHPTATVEASSIDAFVSEVLSGNVSQIPRLSDEIGDSWLYGAPADPVKVSTFREARRAMDEAVAAGRISPDWPQYDSYMRRLMKGPPSHNWGLSIGNYLPELRYPDSRHPNFTTWPNDAFAAARSGAGYQRLEQEWAAQREYIHPLPSWSRLRGWTRRSPPHEREWAQFTADLEQRLLPLRFPPAFNVSGLAPTTVQRLGRVKCDASGATLEFSPADGSLISLMDGTGREYAGPNNSLGAFRYVTYNGSDFALWASEYNNHGGDFAKPGMASAQPESATWSPSVTATWADITSERCVVISSLSMDALAHHKYGAPQNVSLRFSSPGTEGALVDIAVAWHNKTATRLPESSWLSFQPRLSPAGGAWAMDVLGFPVNPLGVVRRGTRHKHAVQRNVTLTDADATGRRFVIEMLDTAIVAPGDIMHLLRYNDDQPATSGGMHANLHNNLWGTAFPQWYDDDLVARFRLHTTPP